MPITCPLGLTHLLPGEQSVSNEHARAWMLERTNAEVAILNFCPVRLMIFLRIWGTDWVALQQFSTISNG